MAQDPLDHWGVLNNRKEAHLDKALKERLPDTKIRSIIGGAGPTFDRSLLSESTIDYYYLGEGDYALPEFILSGFSTTKNIARIGEDPSDEYFPFLVFYDDTFILNRTWLQEFADRIPREIGLPYSWQIRANLVDEEIVQLLKTSNCTAAPD